MSGHRPTSPNLMPKLMPIRCSLGLSGLGRTGCVCQVRGHGRRECSIHDHRCPRVRPSSKEHGVMLLHHCQQLGVGPSDVVSQELHIRVVEHPHCKDRIALVENALCDVRRPLRYDNGTETVLPTLQESPRGARDRMLLRLACNGVELRHQGVRLLQDDAVVCALLTSLILSATHVSTRSNRYEHSTRAN